MYAAGAPAAVLISVTDKKWRVFSDLLRDFTMMHICIYLPATFLSNMAEMTHRKLLIFLLSYQCKNKQIYI